MTAGMYIVAVCALGGLIAAVAFWWAVRAGEFGDAAEAKWLVFDEEDVLEQPGAQPHCRTGAQERDAQAHSRTAAQSAQQSARS